MEESRKEDEISLKTSLGCRQSAKKKESKTANVVKTWRVIEDIDHKAKQMDSKKDQMGEMKGEQKSKLD